MLSPIAKEIHEAITIPQMRVDVHTAAKLSSPPADFMDDAMETTVAWPRVNAATSSF